MIVTCFGSTFQKNSVIFTRNGKKCQLTLSSYHRLMQLISEGVIERLSTYSFGEVLITTYKGS
jgi:hypothetical protein